MISIKKVSIKRIESKYIDKEKWDQTVANSPVQNIFMYSWYLDAVTEHWNGIVSENYATIFPITVANKIGVEQFHQAIFTREFEVIGSDFELETCLEQLEKKTKYIQFRSSRQFKLNSTERVHQILALNAGFESEYSKNAKRLIKKSDKTYTYRRVNCIEVLIGLVKENVAHKIKEFTPENMSKLESLMHSAFNAGKGETIAVFEGEKIVAAGFFLKDKSTVTYLKGASTEEAKRNGAMFGLMNFAFKSYQEKFNSFDFGGSNVESVATFYKKFGARDKKYYEYTINNLPLWFRLLKKLKK